MSKLGYLRSEKGAYSQNRGDDIVENIRVTLRHNSSNENNGPVFVRINVGLQFVFRIYRPNCPRLFLNGNCNNFYNSRTWLILLYFIFLEIHSDMKGPEQPWPSQESNGNGNSNVYLLSRLYCYFFMTECYSASGCFFSSV